jgi:hypothetical protein
MPKLHCPCGNIHDLSPIPDDGWVVVRDKDYEELIASEVGSEAGGRTSVDAFMKLAHRMYECEKCGRLVWPQNGCDLIRVFVPEAHEG